MKAYTWYYIYAEFVYMLSLYGNAVVANCQLVA